MVKVIVFAAILALAVADPEPKAKPGVVVTAYTAPFVGAPLAYTAPVVSAYSAPVVSSYTSTYHVIAPAVAVYSAPAIYA